MAGESSQPAFRLPASALSALERAPATDAAPVLATMDPRLQRMVAMRRQGVQKRASASTDANEAAVVAKVTDADAWESLSEVRMGARVGLPASDGTTIVTGRIPLDRIEHVRGQPFVQSMKAATRVTAALNRTVPELASAPDGLPPGHLASGGAHAIVGIVDFGCDFAHANLRDAAGQSRVAAIWDQLGAAGVDSPFGYGRLMRKPEIDAALSQPDPYQALRYGPDPDVPGGARGSHGTHVTDIAAGNGRGSSLPGVAPRASIMFVELASNDVPWEGPDVVGKSFGDSVQLLEAVTFLFNEAGAAPCVVNLSLGTNGGPHDGTTLVEEGFDRLLSQQPNRAIVLAAANSFADGIHASGTVVQGGQTDLPWVIPNNDGTSNEMELWYAGTDRFTMELIAPDGTTVAVVPPGENRTLTFQGRIVAFLANRLADPNNGDNMLGLFLEPELPPGRWVVRLRGTVVEDGTFHAWIERDDAGQSHFLPPLDNSHTIGSISCGQHTIVVGSYDAHKNALPLSFFSSSGPTRDNREKPEVSAPGHAVVAAHSRTGTGVVQKSGTSMAAPAVTGVVALMLSEAGAREATLPIAAIRDILKQSARAHPEQNNLPWHPRVGAGRAFASAAVARVIEFVQGVAAPAPLEIVAAPHAKRAAARRRTGKKSPAKAPSLPAGARTRAQARRPRSAR